MKKICCLLIIVLQIAGIASCGIATNDQTTSSYNSPLINGVMDTATQTTSILLDKRFSQTEKKILIDNLANFPNLESLKIVGWEQDSLVITNRMSHLSNISIENTQLKVLAIDFHATYQLSSLHLINNDKLVAIDHSLQQLNSLTELKIVGCEAISYDVLLRRNLPLSIQRLTLYGDNMPPLSTCIENMVLKEITFSANNDIQLNQSLAILSKVKQLKKVAISFRTEKFPANIALLSGIDELSIFESNYTKTNGKEWEILAVLQQLKKMVIFKTPMPTIDNISLPINLHYLTLYFIEGGITCQSLNSLTQLDTLIIQENPLLCDNVNGLNHLNKIQQLRLINNQLTELPIGIENYPNLVDLVITRNPIKQIPPSLVNNKQIVNYQFE